MEKAFGDVVGIMVIHYQSRNREFFGDGTRGCGVKGLDA
jgi:hypothetical protein